MDEIALVKKLMRTPYQHRGRDFEEGLDCYGLIIVWYRELFRVELIDVHENYDESWKWNKNLFMENYHRQWKKSYPPKKHDIVLFKNSRGQIDHGGIYLEGGKILHACKAGIVINRTIDVKKGRREVEGFYEFTG